MKAVPLVLAVFEFDFMGGSMGSVVGERFARGVQSAIEQRIAFTCITASGGARMQEGLASLLQMAKTTAAVQRLSAARLPFISILTDPTMGGVSASFAMIGEQTVREKLPEGFQRSEFLLEKGAIDMIVDRRQLRDRLPQLLTQLQKRPTPSP